MFLNPSSYCSISSAANACHWAWEKKNTMMGFFCLLQRNQSFSQKEKWFTGESFVLLTLWGHEKQGFFTCLVFKGFASRNKLFYEAKKKNNFKKNFVDNKAKSAKKKTKCLLHLCLFFKTRLRTTEVQQLLLFLKQATQKLFREQMRKSFFLCILRKQSFQQTNCFFLWTKPFCNEKEKPSKKEVELVLLFFCSFFAFYQSKKNALLQKYQLLHKKWGQHTRVFQSWENFFKPSLLFVLSENCLKSKRKKSKLFLNVISNNISLCLCYLCFFFRVCISKNFLSKHALM